MKLLPCRWMKLGSCIDGQYLICGFRKTRMLFSGATVVDLNAFVEFCGSYPSHRNGSAFVTVWVSLSKRTGEIYKARQPGDEASGPCVYIYLPSTTAFLSINGIKLVCTYQYTEYSQMKALCSLCQPYNNNQVIDRRGACFCFTPFCHQACLSCHEIRE